MLMEHGFSSVVRIYKVKSRAVWKPGEWQE